MGDQAPTKRSRRATRERLLDAASEVFGDQGLAASTVEEVCERAGFTRGAFYSNFASKEELLLAVLDREEARVLERLSAAVAAAPKDGDLVTVVTERLFELQPFGSANHGLRAELSLLSMRDPHLAAPYLAARVAFRERFRPFLERALDGAGLALTVDADDALSTIEGLFESSVREAMITGADPNAGDTLARRMLPTLLRAMTRAAE
ncbi:MAG: TetR/AcrR family transcriptional regulator [Dermatophilaceae bacterium]